MITTESESIVVLKDLKKRKRIKAEKSIDPNKKSLISALMRVVM
jgi:hypothetical protein